MSRNHYACNNIAYALLKSISKPKISLNRLQQNGKFLSFPVLQIAIAKVDNNKMNNESKIDKPISNENCIKWMFNKKIIQMKMDSNNIFFIFFDCKLFKND